MSGIYFHIPFCGKKCIYCDFYSIETVSENSKEAMEKFISALSREIDLRKDEVINNKPHTIFIGGGTPNILSIKLLEKLLSKIYNTFYEKLNISEYTIESNPEYITKEKLKLFSDYGINRISIGIQSFNDTILQVLGRLSNKEKNFKAIDIIKKSKINNLNCDMIYGLPDQNKQKLEQDIKIIIEQNPEHISYYCLTVEENTPLHNMVKTNLITTPDNDASADMYLLVTDELDANNYSMYEISNFAKLGHHSLHNLGYWDCEKYFGFGASATSYNGDVRFSNYFSVNDYINALERNILPVGQSEKLSQKQHIIEFIMLSFRKTEGMDLNKFKNNFGFSLTDLLTEKESGLLKHTDFITYNNKYLSLTKKGLLIYNYIVSEIISLL